MKLHTSDLLIICAYLIAMIVIGLILKKRAAQNMDSYFLGGKSLPFYMLGLSNASGMFDITGTMLMVYWAFAYGFKSLWIPWLWPVFNQIFLMVYLSVWLRRSNVLTGAEWIKTRFGKGKGATLSHTIVVVFALFKRTRISELRIHRNRQVHGNLLFPGKSFHPTFLSLFHRSMFRMYTVSSSQLSLPSTSCWEEC